MRPYMNIEAAKWKKDHGITVTELPCKPGLMRHPYSFAYNGRHIGTVSGGWLLARAFVQGFTAQGWPITAPTKT